MDGRLFQNPEALVHTPDYGVPSRFPGGKMSASSSPKGRRAVQKRVVSVPIADVDGSRAKGEGAPPSDSWAWRKYGQKPIKGSPYPRGYYRCSSSKGCPARKQVERSRVDPTMLMVTYTCEHNHPWPLSRTSNSTNRNPPKESPILSGQPEIEPEDRFAYLETDATLLPNDITWFSDPTPSPVLESPICMDAMLLPKREEEDELFADLGELPEYSTVLRRAFYEREEESRRCSLRAAPMCGSTG